jgi:hypothetical protein
MEQLSRAEQLKLKRSYWKDHIDSWQDSGLSQAEYCRRHNLKHHQLVYWKKRFIKAETSVSMVPLKFDELLDMPWQSDQAALCLVINDHFKIEIRSGFDAQLLRQLIFALQGLA